METPLISILRDYINRRETLPFDTDWQALYDLSKKHEVAAIVYAQCKSFIPEEYSEAFMRAFSVTLYYSANRMEMYENVEQALSRLEHFTVKGPVIADFYPHPELRTMGDIDIVIHKEDRLCADSRLKELSPDSVQNNEGFEWRYTFGDIVFEIHDGLIYDEVISKDIYKDYFGNFWKYVKDNKLDESFHFLYLILHLRKHFMNTGVGIRQFTDIAVLCLNDKGINWGFVKEELSKLGLKRFTERVFALNKYWFEATPPFEPEPLNDDFIISATELILKNGVFGFNNNENRDNAIVNAVREAENSKKAMAKVALNKMFPKYVDLIKEPYYNYLKGKKYLVPAAWAHRIIRSVINRRVKKNMKILADTSFTDQNTVLRRKQIYEQWGL